MTNMRYVSDIYGDDWKIKTFVLGEHDSGSAQDGRTSSKMKQSRIICQEMQYFWEKDYLKYDRVYSDKIWCQFVGKVKRFMALANKTGSPKQKRVEIQNIVLWISLARQFNKSSSDIAASLVSLQIPVYRKSFTWSSWISLLRRASYWLTKTFLLSMS